MRVKPEGPDFHLAASATQSESLNAEKLDPISIINSGSKFNRPCKACDPSSRDSLEIVRGSVGSLQRS